MPRIRRCRSAIRRFAAAFLCMVMVAGQGTAETDALRTATQAAEAYAMTREGIAILIHVGDDIPNPHFASGDEFGDALVQRFENDFGVAAQAFPRANPDTPATVISYHIGHLVHGADSGTEIKDVQAALAAMPDVVAQFRLIQELGATLNNEAGN